MRKRIVESLVSILLGYALFIGVGVWPALIGAMIVPNAIRVLARRAPIFHDYRALFVANGLAIPLIAFHFVVAVFVWGVDVPHWTVWSGPIVFAFGILLGPVILPFASEAAFADTPQHASPRSFEVWDERGFGDWLRFGLGFGARMSWPFLLIGASAVELGRVHQGVLATIPAAVGWSARWLFDEARKTPRTSAPRGRATTAIALYALMLPWCLALMTPNPIWRVDAEHTTQLPDQEEVQPGVTVAMEEGPFFVTGFTLYANDSSSFIRAPLAVLAGVFSEEGRVVLPYELAYESVPGAFYVPIAPDGTRLDDSLVDRIIARTRFERFGVFAFLPFVPLLVLAVLLLMRAPWRSVHASLARVEGVLDVREQTLVATNSVSLHFEDGDVWTLREGESLPMRFEGTCEPVRAGERLELIFEGAAEEGAFRASHRREALLDVRHAAKGQTPKTRMPTEGGLMLVALYGAMLFAVWWVWSGV